MAVKLNTQFKSPGTVFVCVGIGCVLLIVWSVGLFTVFAAGLVWNALHGFTFAFSGIQSILALIFLIAMAIRFR